MRPKSDLPGVSDPNFDSLIEEFPPQALFAAVFGVQLFPDDVWHWFKHVILCLMVMIGPPLS